MARTTSYTLSEELNRFIRDQVETGGYASASHVVREALATLAEEKRKEKWLTAALEEGEKSGRSLTHATVWKGLRKKIEKTKRA